MKILYAIQGTGNGHLTRAKEMIPILQQKGDLDILLSGNENNLDLGYPIKFHVKGVNFTFGKKGGIDFWQTFKKLNTWNFLKEIKSLPVKNYDLIINDFEPVSAWAAKLNQTNIISLSHQNAVLDEASPKYGKYKFEKWILKYYAPSKIRFGFHFKTYSSATFTPIIRKKIRNKKITNKGHYTINEFEFIESITSSAGILCGAGFETPSEALFLRKKLMVIPMKNQYEQQCNALALKEMGVKTLKKLSHKNVTKIIKWLDNDKIIEVNYPDTTEDILEALLLPYYNKTLLPTMLS
jgi:UDP-N-acetylglucosamine:LPS N-acetylglucosamine transferase